MEILLKNGILFVLLGHKNPSGWVMIFFNTNMSFFENLMKKLDSGWSFWFSLPVSKIKFNPFQQRKNALVFIFKVLH